jgi:hypothetical protein
MLEKFQELVKLSSDMLAVISECRALCRAIRSIAYSALQDAGPEAAEDLRDTLEAIEKVAWLLDARTGALLDVACAQHARIDALQFEARKTELGKEV